MNSLISASLKSPKQPGAQNAGRRAGPTARVVVARDGRAKLSSPGRAHGEPLLLAVQQLRNPHEPAESAVFKKSVLICFDMFNFTFNCLTIVILNMIVIDH